MVFNNLTMNLEALQNISAPNLSLSNVVSFDNLVVEVNSLTNNYVIFASLFIIGIIMYWVLTDTGVWQDFGYDYIRGLNISLGTCVIIGLNLVEQGWSPNFYAVGVFGTLWFLSYIGVLVVENQE